MSSVADLADVEFCYLTTTGRTSGRSHRIEIWFVAHADGAYLLSNSADADWYRNLVGRAAGRARDRGGAAGHDRSCGGCDRSGEPRIVRPAMVAKYQASYAQEDLREWSDTASLVRVDWPDRRQARSSTTASP